MTDGRTQEEIMKSAFGYRTEEELAREDDKIKEVFGLDDKQEQPPADPPGKKEEEPKKEEQPPEPKEELSKFLTKEQAEEIVNKSLSERIQPIEQKEKDRMIDAAMTKSNKLKLAYNQAIEDGDTEKANELYDQLLDAETDLRILKKKPEEKPKQKKLEDLVSKEEMNHVSIMVNHLRKEMFEGEEGKARMDKLSNLHVELIKAYPEDPQTRLAAVDRAMKFLKDNSITSTIEASVPLHDIQASMPTAEELEKLMTMTPD